MVKNIANLIIRAFLALSIAILLWIVIANMLNISDEYFLVPIVILVITCVTLMLPKNLIKGFIRKYSKYLLALLVVLALVSIALRISFIFLEYAPGGDAKVFLNMSQYLLDTGNLHVKYLANYPYLLSYTAVLGTITALFNNSLLSAVAINVFFDILSALLLYFLLKKLTTHPNAPIVVASLWLINPFNIIFSGMMLPLTIVNTLIIASILVTYMLIKNTESDDISTVKVALLGVATGSIYSLANSFRPFMAVFVIGFVVHSLIYLMTHFKITKLWSVLISIMVVCTTFFILNLAYTNLVSKLTGYPPTLNPGGWSVYVGSNYETWGGWNERDVEYKSSLYKGDGDSDINTVENKLQQDGINRWLSLTPLQTLDLLIKKSIRLGGDLYHSIYNIADYPTVWSQKSARLLLPLFCIIFALTLTLLSVRLLLDYFHRKYQKIDFIHFMSIVFVGLFVASLLVEVANRYFMPFLTLLSIFSVLCLYRVPETCHHTTIRQLTNKD